MVGVMTELPRIATVFGYPSHGECSHSNPGHKSSSSTTLPSFASFQEQTNRTDLLDEADIAPMSTLLPCHTHAQIQPMLVEIATAVVELDETMQHFIKGEVSRVSVKTSLYVSSTDFSR